MLDADPWAAAYRSGDTTLERIGHVLAQIEQVRQILRFIACQSRDEFACQQAEKALRLLEIPDGSR